MYKKQKELHSHSYAVKLWKFGSWKSRLKILCIYDKDSEKNVEFSCDKTCEYSTKPTNIKLSSCMCSFI